MALYWHPFLAELLRHDYGDRLIVEEEVSLGDMPLRADLLLIRRDPTVVLPFPFCFLGTRTLVEYKSPDDRATQDNLLQLEIYGLMYTQRERIVSRQELTLWLMASHFAERLSRPEGAYLLGEQEVGPGVRGGMMDRFPTFLLDLRHVPFQPEVLPLSMVTRGPQERVMIEFLIEHFRDYPRHMQFVRELHVQTLLEVLRMKQLTPEQIGTDYQALLELIGEERVLDLIGTERVLDLIGTERVLDLIGAKRALDLIGAERLLDDLLGRKGETWLREMLERRTRQSGQTRPDADPKP